MATINDTIAQLLLQKDALVNNGVDTMRQMLAALQQQVRGELGKAALGSFDQYRLKQMLDAIEQQINVLDADMQRSLDGLLSRAWDLGQKAVYLPLNEAGIYTGFNLGTSTLEAFKDFALHKAAGLTYDAWAKIKSELTLGIMGAQTPQEAAAAIGENLTDPGIFSSIAARAEVITKTEMGRVFSKASQLRMEQATNVVAGLEKQWIHAGNPMHPRITHEIADGQHVPVDEPFKVGGIEIMYPRSPDAPLDEVINCGCDHVPYMESWG